MSIKQLSASNTDSVSAYCAPEHSVLYTNLDNDIVEQLDQIAMPVTLEAHDYLLHQHSDARRVFYIYSGVLQVERIASTGRRQVLAFLFPGDFLGFTHNHFFEFSVQTLTPTTLVAYQRKEFFQLCDECPTLKHNIDQISSNVLAQSLDQVFALGQKKAHERVCFLLNQLLRRQSGATPEHIALAMTRQDIADYLGLTIETVSRAFAKLVQMQIIRINHIYDIAIVDMDLLEELACSE